jgi:hypothetical protein
MAMVSKYIGNSRTVKCGGLLVRLRLFAFVPDTSQQLTARYSATFLHTQICLGILPLPMRRETSRAYR